MFKIVNGSTYMIQLNENLLKNDLFDCNVWIFFHLVVLLTIKKFNSCPVDLVVIFFIFLHKYSFTLKKKEKRKTIEKNMCQFIEYKTSCNKNFNVFSTSLRIITLINVICTCLIEHWHFQRLPVRIAHL